MYTIIGKYFLHGVTSSGDPYEYYRVFCTASPSDDELRAGFEGLKTKAFNFSASLFKSCSIGDTFNQALFGEYRSDRDKIVLSVIS